MRIRLVLLGLACLAIVAVVQADTGLASPHTTLVLAPAAQEEGVTTVTRHWRFKVKPGMEAEFEEAVKAHMQWRRQQNDTWTLIAYTVETGDDVGQYGFLSPNHQWGDFDAYDAEHRDAVTANYRETLAPYVESFTSSITTNFPGLSRGPDAGEPFSLVQVIQFHVKYERADDFPSAVGKIHKALDEADWPVRYSWSALTSGGEGPLYNLALFYPNWAAMAAPDADFNAILEHAYGKHDADEIMRTLAACVWNTSSFTARIRPDLSYAPEAPEAGQ